MERPASRWVRWAFISSTRAMASAPVWVRERDSVNRQSAPPCTAARSNPAVTAAMISGTENWGQWVGFRIISLYRICSRPLSSAACSAASASSSGVPTKEQMLSRKARKSLRSSAEQSYSRSAGRGSSRPCRAANRASISPGMVDSRWTWSSTLGMRVKKAVRCSIAFAPLVVFSIMNVGHRREPPDPLFSIIPYRRRCANPRKIPFPFVRAVL